MVVITQEVYESALVGKFVEGLQNSVSKNNQNVLILQKGIAALNRENFVKFLKRATQQGTIVFLLDIDDFQVKILGRNLVSFQRIRI